MLKEDVKVELNNLFAAAGLDAAIIQVNVALEKAGHPFRVDTVTFSDVRQYKPCRCLEWGVNGEHCRTVNGERICTPTYGCKIIDCT